MLNIVDTSADVVWLSVTTVQDEQGVTETRPQNDTDWTAVHNGAITLAEAANLLMIPGRHVARPGEKSETPGIELEPEEMEVLINKDRNGWNERAKALRGRDQRRARRREARRGQNLRDRRGDRARLRELPQAVLVSE